MFFDRMFADYFGVQYNHAGEFVFARGAGRLMRHSGPHAFVTYPGVRFRYGVVDGSTRHHSYVVFKGPRVKQFIESGLFPLNKDTPLIEVVDRERFLTTMRQLRNAIDRGPSDYEQAVHLLEGLLLQLHRQPLTGKGHGNLAEPIDHLGREIQRCPSGQWSFPRIADELKISYSHFRRLFCTRLGMAPNRFVQDCRLKTAAELLCTTSQPIKHIASQVGIADVYHFSKLFKQRYHMPPGRYRNEFRS